VLAVACLIVGGVVLNATPAAATFSNGRTDWERPLGWCNHNGAQLHIGDFNGDNKDDMLCHDTNNGHKWIAYAKGRARFTGTDWERPLGWCNHNGAQLHIGDFNGDNKDDMLCHDTNNGHKWIAYAKGRARFTGTDWERPLGWCNHNGAQLHIGDFNGDNKDDMLCHDTNNGHKWIAYAKGRARFSGTDWERPLGWCNHNGAQLHIGDFTGDNKDDMLCHDTNNGHKWVAYAKGQGSFTGTDWERPLGWCNHNGARLHIGNFNGDRRDDMLCHDINNGHKWVAYAKGQGSFTGTDWERSMSWCNHAGARLYIGNFNGDRRDDMLCHDTNNGHKWIAYSDL